MTPKQIGKKSETLLMEVEGYKEKIAQYEEKIRAAKKTWRKIQKLCQHKSYQLSIHKRCPDCLKLMRK